MTVEKAAKVISKDEPQKAIELYSQGLELCQQDDRTKLAGEFLSQITRLNLVQGKYPEAAQAIRSEITKYTDVNVSFPSRHSELPYLGVSPCWPAGHSTDSCQPGPGR